MDFRAARPIALPVSRAAMTLLELLIVLIVMVGLLAIAWPSLSRPLADDGLRRAAGVLRDEIGLARMEAMQRGQPIVMRLELQSGRGSVHAWQQLLSDGPDSVARGGDAVRRSATAGAARPAFRDMVRDRSFDLPETVVVVAVAELSTDPRPVDADSSGETANRLAGAELPFTAEGRSSGQQPPDQESADGSAWLVFLPDGRSTGRSILLHDRERGRQLELRYDAGTGLTELSPVRRASHSTASSSLPPEVTR